jgi:two-component system OmpR family response regulator
VIATFDFDEVTARIHTVCRRSADQLTQIAMVRDLTILLLRSVSGRAGIDLFA